MAPSSTARYDRSIKITVYERAAVPEVWLVNPKRRSVAIYRLVNGHDEPPSILTMSGRTPLTAVPDVSVNWDRVNARIIE